MTEFFFIFDVALTFQNYKLRFVLSRKALLGDERRYAFLCSKMSSFGRAWDQRVWRAGRAPSV